MFENFAQRLEIYLIFSSKFRAKFFVWLSLPLLPWLIKFVAVLYIAFLALSLPAQAQVLNYTDAFPYTFYGDHYQPSYCTTTVETLVGDELFICKRVTVHPVLKLPYSNGVTPDVYGRGYCWQSSYGGFWGGYGRSSDFEGVLISQEVDFSMSPPIGTYDPNKICKRKSEVAPLICDINITSIVNGAFSNKFPLDLFTGFAPVTVSPACPSFTIEGQTFSLCYINDLTRVLKYTLLLVFIISSVIAL